MSAENYLLAHRQELLRIYSEIYSGRQIELVINPSTSEQSFLKECCASALAVHKDHNGIVDFPLPSICIDDNLVDELCSIVLCEDATYEGKLVRNGLKYAPSPRLGEHKFVHEGMNKYIEYET